MVFSSVNPPYLDHHNWHHQLVQSNHQGTGGVSTRDGENPNLQPPPPVPSTAPVVRDGTGGEDIEGSGSIKPGSMVDRARLAKIPLPQPGLNCPRCDSTNTKFCYFNNYSLTQPRHFCKTCRRYWTRGGALRNIPVGGGCRRNKQSSKTRSSKSPSQSDPKSLSVSPPRISRNSENMTISSQIPHPPNSLNSPFMSSLTQLYGGHLGVNNLTGFQSQIGNYGSNFNMLSTGGGENWRLSNFSNPLIDFQTECIEAQSSLMVGGDVSLNNDSSIENPQINRDLLVKAEDNDQGLNLSRQFLGMMENTINPQPWDDQFSSGVITTSTSTTHFL